MSTSKKELTPKEAVVAVKETYTTLGMKLLNIINKAYEFARQEKDLKTALQIMTFKLQAEHALSVIEAINENTVEPPTFDQDVAMLLLLQIEDTIKLLLKREEKNTFSQPTTKPSPFGLN